MKIILLFVCAIAPWLFFNPVFSETITLKSGKSVEGKILERANTHIKIDILGVPVTYYLDEIETIDAAPVSNLKKDSPIASPANIQEVNTPLTAQNIQEVLPRISPAIVFISKIDSNGEQWQGRGFIINSDGVVVTNLHVAADPKEINVKLKDGAIYPVTGIISYDANLDVCLLKIDAHNLPVLSLADSSSSKIGEKIYAITNPENLDSAFSEGTISRIKHFQNIKYLQFTAPVVPGHSGSPLLNSQGQVLGVISSETGELCATGLAIAINEIKPLISTTPKVTIGQFSAATKSNGYRMRGEEFFYQKDYQQAITYYQKAIESDPRYVKAYANMGLAYEYLGQYDKAISYYQKAIELDPDCAMAYNDVSNVYEHMGNSYRGMGKLDQAISCYRKSVELYPDNTASYINMGNIYGDLGEYDKAISCYQKAIQINPNYAEAYYNMGNAYNALDKQDMAVSYYQKTIQLDSAHALAYGNLGFLYQTLGKNKQAEENYLKAKELLQKQGNDKDVQKIENLLKNLPKT